MSPLISSLFFFQGISNVTEAILFSIFSIINFTLSPIIIIIIAQDY
jgi:hypothetical protein